jgi:hypothetical protein
MALQNKFLVNATILDGTATASSITFSAEGYLRACIQGYTDTADVYFQIVSTSREKDDGSPDWDYDAYGSTNIYAITPGATWSSPLYGFPICAKYARINFLTTLGPVSGDAICKCVVILQDEKGT